VSAFGEDYTLPEPLEWQEDGRKFVEEVEGVPRVYFLLEVLGIVIGCASFVYL